MPLSEAQRIEIESLIRQRRSQLAAEINRGVERARDDNYDRVAGEAPDSGDESVASLLADTENAETTRDLRELQELDEALRRIADGSYDTCDECGDDIPFERLRAYPAARRCVPCQSMYEKTHNHPSEPTL
jgi:RNA polymerase-binding transcription factor DksA